MRGPGAGKTDAGWTQGTLSCALGNALRVFGEFTRYKLTSLQVTYTSCNDFSLWVLLFLHLCLKILSHLDRWLFKKKKSALNFGFGLYFDFVYQIAFFGHITIISVLKIGYMSKKSSSVSPNPWVFYTLPFFHFAFSFVCFCFFSFFCKNIKKKGEF